MTFLPPKLPYLQPQNLFRLGQPSLFAKRINTFVSGSFGYFTKPAQNSTKRVRYQNREEILLDISRTLFFAGFHLFTKKQEKNLEFWKNINPENKKIRIPKSKKSKLESVSLQSKCTNLFHFLARHSNLSKQRPTKCPCRNVSSNTSNFKSQPITIFLHKFPKTTNDKGIPDPFHLFSSSRNDNFKTRTDAIMVQHDRLKKRKKSQS